MILRYILFSLVLYSGKLATWLLAPIFALFVVYREESETTGFTSLVPNKPRAFLIRGLRWAQTQDAPVDEYYALQHRYATQSYKNKITGEIEKRDKWTRKWINLPIVGGYFARVFWLVRNPAYGLAERLGFSQDGIKITYDSKTNNWRKNVTGYDLQKAVNSYGQRGFLIQGQWLYSKTRKLEYRLGYGLTRSSPKRSRGMIYARVLPWEKV